MIGIGRKAVYVMCSLLAVIVLVNCQKDSENEKVARVIASFQSATEDKDIGKILSQISKQYRDPQGNDYDGIKGLMLFHFLRHQKISVLLSNLEVTLKQDAADARFQVLLSGRAGSTGNILPETMGAYRFLVNLVRETGEWKVSSAQWERFGDEFKQEQ